MTAPAPEATKTFPAVILAAGRGARLRAEGTLKPLTPLLGLTLLERAVLTCRDAGIRECYVVVGYGKSHLLPHLEALSQRYGLSVHGVENTDWEAGNGTSVLAVQPYVSGRFLLMMCDHVFDPALVETLLHRAGRVRHSLLAVDRRLDQIFDLDDATKVRLHGTHITAIGKGLTPYDAVDTGLFWCRPTVFDALAEARAQGDGSLTGGMRRLAQTGALQAVDIGEAFWCDIDTPASLQHAERFLLSSARKSSDDGLVSRDGNTKKHV